MSFPAVAGWGAAALFVIASLRYLSKILFRSRALWFATTAIGPIAYNRGHRDRTLPNILITPDKVDKCFLSFNQRVEIHRDRTARDAAIMALISFTAFWRYQAEHDQVQKEKFKEYEIICMAAAQGLGVKEYCKSENPAQFIEDAVNKAFDEEKSFLDLNRKLFQ
jgi:hypothetical protein